MNNFVMPKAQSIFYREKDWKLTPNPKLKKGQVNAPTKPGTKSYPATLPSLKPQIGYAEIRAIWEGKTIDALKKKDGW